MFSITHYLLKNTKTNNAKVVLRLQIPISVWKKNTFENNEISNYARTNQEIVRWKNRKHYWRKNLSHKIKTQKFFAFCLILICFQFFGNSLIFQMDNLYMCFMPCYSEERLWAIEEWHMVLIKNFGEHFTKITHENSGIVFQKNHVKSAGASTKPSN